MTAKKKRPTSDPVPTGKKKKAAKPSASPTPVLRHVLTVAAALDWDEQRRRWRRLRRALKQHPTAVP